MAGHPFESGQLHPNYVGYIYSRYKRFGDDTMDESFFPILWREDGYRSPFIDPYVERRITWGEAVPARTVQR
ncbi:MAG: hypothetical protein WD928_09060 [Gammaproteobacteria bacterium]